MTRIAASLGALALVMGLTACSDSTRPDTSSSSAFDPFATFGSSGSGTATESGAPTSPSLLAIGDCFDADNFVPGAPIDRGTVRLVPCADPHQHEVYAIDFDPDPPRAPFPGADAMRSLSDDRCLAQFETAIGSDYLNSSYDFAAIVPDAQSWSGGDRSIICAAHSGDFAPLTGSVRRSTSSESG